MLITKTVEVTQEMLDADQRIADDRCGTCPVAQAIHIATGRKVFVGIVSWNFQGETTIYALPASIVNNIRDIDCHDPVAPFSFPITYDASEAA